MRYLSADEHDKVTSAVEAAEAHTSGEIVTVLTDRSDGYSDIALAWSAAAAFTAMAVWSLFPDFYFGLIDRLLGGWNHSWTPALVLTTITAVAILKFLGMWLLQLWRPLKFALVPGPVKTARVRERAIDLFKVGADRRTQGRTGVLLYVSLHEHRAEIVADQSISEKVAPEVWGEAMFDMLEHISRGRVGDGLVAGIRDVGAVLAEHFPRVENDINELPDRLVEI